MTEDADNQQGFADLREGRYRRITPEVLKQEQGAASIWRHGKNPILVVSGREFICEAVSVDLADRIIADHELAAWAVRAREALSNRAGYCWHCGNFTGVDKVQGGTGDAIHEEWCQIGPVLVVYPGSTATEGIGQ